MEISDSETKSDKLSSAHPQKLVVTQIDPSSEEEEEIMDLKKGSSLNGLLANRNKGMPSKQASKSQVPPNLPPPPRPTDLCLEGLPDLKKKRSFPELEKGEVGLQKGIKQQKVAKDPQDKRSNSVDSREEQPLAKVRIPQQVRSPRLKVEGAPISWNASIREYQRGHSQYVAEALEQPLLLPKDMDAVRKLKQHDPRKIISKSS